MANLTIHDLRHTFATWAMSFAGLTRDEVGSLLNHAGSTVKDIYAKRILEKRLELAELVTATILERVQPTPTTGNVVAIEVMKAA